MCLGHLLDVGRHDAHPVARRVVAAHAAKSLLDGLRGGRAIAGPHGQDTGTPHHRHEIGLVQSADPRHQITEVLCHARGVVSEVPRRVLWRSSRLFPPSSEGR